VDFAVIGLAQSGKTTLFDALTRGHARAAAYGQGVEPNIGVVKVPDKRLDDLCALIKSRKVTPIDLRYLDFPGGFSGKGDAPAAREVASLAQCDALVHVVRAFGPDADPERDVAAMNLELTFADAAVLERRHEKLEITVRSARAGEREPGERELALIDRLRVALDREEPIRRQELSPDERRALSGYQLLTNKPLLLVLNVDEGDAARAAEIAQEYASRHAGPGVEVVAVCAKLEQELGELTDEEAAEFREQLGLAGAEPGVDRLVQLSQQVLGLITFFTIGEQEGRAWPLAAGSTALDAAGKIHTDIARGFIRCEVIRWQELLDCGSYAEARKRGLLRTEGKQYVVEDGDVLHVLFNV
jgi:GTP-binding protein YchF